MKKYLVTLLIITCSLLNINAQVLCSATGDSGSGYNAITSTGFEIENPDCRHGDFGAHITMTYDELLKKNVFQFHSHIDEDTDRCQVEDRIRMEIKGGPSSNLELRHPEGSVSYYRWKFKVPTDFVGASSFCHIFQDKIKGGGDSSFPVITFTLRSSILEVIHNGGDTGGNLGRLSSVDIDKVKGKWMEAYVSAIHSENGQLVVKIKDMSTQEVLVDYENTDIDLWRDGAEYSRPKYGIYRAKNSALKDEIILFADFCVSETSEDLCPADPFIILDDIAPSVPTGLVASNININSVTLSWDMASDNIGVQDYILYQDDVEVYRGNALFTSVSTDGSTAYQFAVSAMDAAGNESDKSVPVTVITDDTGSLPEAPSNVSPLDGTMDRQIPTFLNWNSGKNTDNFNIYIGTTQTPSLVSSQIGNGYSAANLEENTTYYWRVGASNINGETLGDLWSFTTGASNSDLPWKVYRANERMHIETDFLTESDRPADPDIDLVFTDPENAGNSLYSYYEEDDEKFRWRNTFSNMDTAFTVVARIKALNEDVNCVCYFEVRGFGFREKVRINQSTIKLERSSPVIEKDIPFDILADFHTLRMTMSGNKAYIYLDENPTPFAIGNSTTTDTNFNFEWGKSGSNSCGGTIDWLTILNNQAIAPDEGPSLPSDLIMPTAVSVKENLTIKNIKIYPNPTTNLITIAWESSTKQTLRLRDISGKILHTQRSTSGDKLDMTMYPIGIYFLEIKDDKSKKVIKKVLKIN